MTERGTLTRVADFYHGKTIFITGSSGFLGSVLLETLLRCIPEIKEIFILLRSKRGVDPETRKNALFKKGWFKYLLNTNPDAINKVQMIPGDVSLPNLGMSDEDIEKISLKVSIVFHNAAIIKFSRPLKYLAQHNSMGTKYVIDICRKLQKLEALIYTSTAYSNSNRLDIEEIIYRLPFNSKKFIDTIENGSEGDIDTLASMCKPNWPNGYTFSKCLAENILYDLASDLPFAIVRPALICATYKGPWPFYGEEGSGIMDFTVATAKGFARVMNLNPKTRMEFVPADYVANALIVAGWNAGTQRSPFPLVINTCSGDSNMNLNLQQFNDELMAAMGDDVMPNQFIRPSMKFIENKFLFWIFAVIEHYIPAFVMDSILSYKGSKFRLTPLYNLLHNFTREFSPFTSYTFTFKHDQYKAVERSMHPKDKELFYMDMTHVDYHDMLKLMPQSVYFDWSTDKKTKEQRRKLVDLRTKFVYFIQFFEVILLMTVVYLVFAAVYTFVW